jgi:hypothetical protein
MAESRLLSDVVVEDLESRCPSSFPCGSWKLACRTGGAVSGSHVSILAAAIRMVDQSLARPLGGHGTEQRLHDQLLRHPGIEGVADQFAVE